MQKVKIETVVVSTGETTQHITDAEDMQSIVAQLTRKCYGFKLGDGTMLFVEPANRLDVGIEARRPARLHHVRVVEENTPMSVLHLVSCPVRG